QPRSFGLIRRLPPQQASAHHGRQSQRNQQRHQYGYRQGHGKLLEQASHQPAHEQHGNEDRHQREAHGKHRKTHLPGAPDRRAHGRHAPLYMAHDVFKYNNGIVHHKTGGDNQGHQRNGIQGIAEPQHQAEGRDQRRGHRDSRNQGCPKVAQEQQHHQRHQDHRNQQGDFSLVQRGPYAGRTVLRNRQGHMGGQHRRAGGDMLTYGIDGLDKVGIGLAADNQQYGLPVIEKTRVEDVFNGVLHAGDILQADGRTLTPRNNQRLVLFGAGQLPARADLPVIAVVLHNP